MLRLFFVRHGQTIYNTKDTVQGWNDSPLTENGIFQAKCTGYGLKDVKFEVIYSGDCDRQINTAKQVISQNNNPVSIIPDMHFREMCYGKYQGGSYYNMLNPLYKMHNAEYDGYFGLYKYMNDYEIAYHVCINDETGVTEGPKRAWDRFSEGLKMITDKYDNCNILVSTSSAIISFMITYLFPDFKQDGLVENASITILDFQDNKYSIEEYNNISYRQLGEKHFQ